MSPLPSASALPGPRGRGPRADLAADDLLPLDADFVSAECKAASADAIRQSRFFAPNDVLFVSVRGGPRALREWSLIRTPRRLRSSGSLAIVALVGVTLTVLVAAGVDTILKVRSGIHALADALVTAQSDLNAPIPRPATRELARIADGLRELMGHLWRAREHGVALERKIAHEARLASLGRVAAGVAHEIRNPLASMKLRLDALARRGLEPRSAKDVSRALDEVARLDRVVGSLLLVARKNVAATELVELRELVEARVAVVEDQARARGVVIERSGRLRTHADPIAFARVLDNLLRNAVEASPPGGTVTITIDAEQTGALLTVTDSGVGVPPEREGELFEPFFTSKPDGTGLGLSLSRAAVEAHGGTLSYRREGQRTSFEVRLPDRLAT